MDDRNDIFDVVKHVSDLAADKQKAEDANDKNPAILDLYGRKYLYRNGVLAEIRTPDPLPEHHPSRFTAPTLSGLIAWIKADTDKLFTKDNPPPLVVVQSPTNVVVLSHAKGEIKERICYAACEYRAPDIPYERYMDSEFWNTKLQSCFVQDECRDTVLRVMNNITEDQSVKTADDGISQRVTVTSGVQGIDSTVFKNPAWLRPMRTFPEVEQPISSFIVRFKEGKQATLIEGDGGKWKVDAIHTIGNYLRDELAGQNVVVIA